MDDLSFSKKTVKKTKKSKKSKRKQVDSDSDEDGEHFLLCNYPQLSITN